MRTQWMIAAVLIGEILSADRAIAQPAESPDESIRAAVKKGVALLEKTGAEYLVQRKCFSCHHQAMPVLALTAAKARGFAIDDKALQRQVQFTADFLAKNRENYSKGKGQGGQTDTAGYALLTLDEGGWKADTTTAAVVEYLLLRDKDRDHWRPVSQRPPSEASAFTTTYLAVRGIKKYGNAEQEKAIDARFEKTRQWLEASPAKDTEDRVFRLLALKQLGAKVENAVKELVKAQRPDGGWSQTDKLDSDAYATGSALVALHQAGGLPTKDDVYARGVLFLVKTQQADGSWYLRSRSKPFQTYFESGFPHGKDQFIACAASSWATIALTLACEPSKR